MTKPQKKQFKKLSGAKERRNFVSALYAQQQNLGKYRHWLPAYLKKCAKKGVKAPIA